MRSTDTLALPRLQHQEAALTLFYCLRQICCQKTSMVIPLTTRRRPLTKALLGFTNTLSIDGSEPVIRAAFRDHKYDETYEDLISEREFFTRTEFRNADHQISGRFDEFGQFSGEVSIYGDITRDHIIPWRNPSGVRTLCGPYGISFAAIEGATRGSTLPPQEYSLMDRKTNKLGGLYIYRDGIRILPYGDTEYDWLDIETRRNKGAGFYYFSHRKMFGVVEIDSQPMTPS